MTENTTPMYMPVAPAYGNGNYGGNGFFGNDGWWIILLLLCFNNGWGGMNGGMNTNNDVQRGFDQNAVMNGINGVQNAVTNGFGNVQTAMCNGFAGVSNGFSQAEIAANARQMADMQQMFALQSQMAQCCCDNRAATADTKFALATEACATRTADAQNANNIMTAMNNGFQSIKDQLCNDKIEQKNDIIAQLRSELMYARGQASQDVQTAAIQAGQRALANEVEQYVLPTPRPAYIVQNPNCCQPYGGCGCGQ